MAQQKEIRGVEPECDADLFDLIDKSRQVPQFIDVRLIAEMRAELIVKIVFDSGRW